MGNDELREKTLTVAKSHKSSWIQLGQYLHTIHSGKLYKDWGYLSFETYCRKELTIRETTAAKLLKSYHFLEREEPMIVKEEYAREVEPKKIPDYESVNLLRLAKDNKKLTEKDFADIREAVIGGGKEPKEVRAQVSRLLEARDNKDPELVRKQRRNTAIKRLITMLGNTKKELENEGLIPKYIVNQINELAEKLQDQIEED